MAFKIFIPTKFCSKQMISIVFGFIAALGYFNFEKNDLKMKITEKIKK